MANRLNPSRRCGVAMVYILCTLTALLGLCSFAVDYARVRVAKTQLQNALDAAALYGATGMRVSPATAESRAIAAAGENSVDGNAYALATTDIEFGVWDPNNRVFNPLPAADRAGATSLRITGKAVVPTFFASLLGRSTVNVTGTAVSTRGKSIKPAINAAACPWLAGMPNGSSVAAQNGNPQASVAPTSSPTAVSGIDLSPGTKLVFRQASGTTSWADGSSGTFGPDGDTTWIVQQAAANGINSTKAPIGAMMGIFLDNRAPNTWAQAAAGDYSTAASRNYSSLTPPLKQAFFIGDGLNSAGALQEVVVPTGATRFYVAVMDENGWWWDNSGTLSTTILDDNVTLVR